MKKRNVRILAAALSVVLLTGAAAMAAGAGTSSDPLVSLSYLTDTLTPSLISRLQTMVTDNNSALTASLNQEVDAYRQQVESADTATFSAVSLSAGQTASLESGGEVLLRSGSAVCDQELTDTTDGTALSAGGSLVIDHLYLSAAGAGTLTAGGSGAQFMVRGSCTLN